MLETEVLFSSSFSYVRLPRVLFPRGQMPRILDQVICTSRTNMPIRVLSIDLRYKGRFQKKENRKKGSSHVEHKSDERRTNLWVVSFFSSSFSWIPLKLFLIHVFKVLLTSETYNFLCNILGVPGTRAKSQFQSDRREEIFIRGRNEVISKGRFFLRPKESR